MIADTNHAIDNVLAAHEMDITDLQGHVSILQGEDGSEMSVRQIAANEVAKIVDSAPTTFDTLKEIADWIASDETATEALVARVVANEKAVTETLPAAIEAAIKHTDDTIANYTVKSVVSGHDAITVDNVDGIVTVGFASDIILNGGNATA